jgi:hypothetical protein
MALKMKLAKFWILFVLLLGSIMAAPVSTLLASANEQTVAASFSTKGGGPIMEGECDDTGSCGL